MAEARTTPLSCGNRHGKRSGGLAGSKGKRIPGPQYSEASYGRAIARACKQADAEARKRNPQLHPEQIIVPSWHPHQLRHNAATWLRKEFGLEVVRTVLGHRSAAITEIYAERDSEIAKDVMRKAG
jgi:integrase